jgi:hypothetical protein
MRAKAKMESTMKIHFHDFAQSGSLRLMHRQCPSLADTLLEDFSPTF